MLLSRDFVGYMAKEVVKRLVAGKMIETKDAESLAQQVRQVMADEVTVDFGPLLGGNATHGRLLSGYV